MKNKFHQTFTRPFNVTLSQLRSFVKPSLLMSFEVPPSSLITFSFIKRGTSALLFIFLLFNSFIAIASDEKIVSIGADVTEIIYALGKGDSIVARDSTSMEPKEAKTLPDVGYMRLLNAEGILSFQPTLIISSIDAGPSTVFSQIEAVNIPVHKISAEKSLEGTITKIESISKILGTDKASEKLIAKYQNSLKSINRNPLDLNALFLLTFDGHKPSVAGKSTAPDILFNVIGVKNAAGNSQKYQPITPESLAMMQPDVIVVTKEGLKYLSEDAIWKLPGIDKTPAFKNKHLIVVDDASFLGFTLETPMTLISLKKSLMVLK